MLIATGAWLAATLLRQAHTLAHDDPIRAALQRAHAAGAYQFDGDVSQVTMPTARITNVGRSNRTEEMHIEGKTNVRESALELTLWSQGGSVADGGSQGLGIKVKNGKSYMRQGSTGEWKETDEVSLNGLAPQGDFMAFLAAVRDVQTHPSETRAGISFIRYTFQLDGPAFAAFVREQMEAALRAKGELPLGAHIETPAYYSQMTGDGELWVRSDGADAGLPLRQILHLNFPPQRDSSTHAQIKINFLAFEAAPQTIWERTLNHVRDALPSPITGGLVLLAFSLIGFLFCFYSSRRLQRVLAVTLVTAIVAGPALNGVRTGQIVSAQVARAAS